MTTPNETENLLEPTESNVSYWTQRIIDIVEGYDRPLYKHFEKVIRELLTADTHYAAAHPEASDATVPSVEELMDIFSVAFQTERKRREDDLDAPCERSGISAVREAMLAAKSGGISRLWLEQQLEKVGAGELSEAIARAEAAERERDELSAWKESMMSVMPPLQEIGKALDVGLGQSIHDKILPGIEALKRERDENGKQADQYLNLWKNAQDQAASLRVEVEGLKAKLKSERVYIKRMDSVIDDERVADSCINPLEDLKRAVAKLKAERDAALFEKEQAINRQAEQMHRADEAEAKLASEQLACSQLYSEKQAALTQLAKRQASTTRALNSDTP